jgi:dienelactone hydrolase
VELKIYQGMIHSFFNMGGFVKAARAAHHDAVSALQRVWGLAP